MLAVAFLLLPGLGLLLWLMTHIEDRMPAGGESSRQPRLRVLPGGGGDLAAASPRAGTHAARRGRHAA